MKTPPSIGRAGTPAIGRPMTPAIGRATRGHQQAPRHGAMPKIVKPNRKCHRRDVWRIGEFRQRSSMKVN